VYSSYKDFFPSRLLSVKSLWWLLVWLVIVGWLLLRVVVTHSVISSVGLIHVKPLGIVHIGMPIDYCKGAVYKKWHSFIALAKQNRRQEPYRYHTKLWKVSLQITVKV
jgi:hypothetical protein